MSKKYDIVPDLESDPVTYYIKIKGRKKPIGPFSSPDDAEDYLDRHPDLLEIGDETNDDEPVPPPPRP
jgi:hypothetical protein